MHINIIVRACTSFAKADTQISLDYSIAIASVNSVLRSPSRSITRGRPQAQATRYNTDPWADIQFTSVSALDRVQTLLSDLIVLCVVKVLSLYALYCSPLRANPFAITDSATEAAKDSLDNLIGWIVIYRSLETRRKSSKRVSTPTNRKFEISKCHNINKPIVKYAANCTGSKFSQCSAIILFMRPSHRIRQY